MGSRIADSVLNLIGHTPIVRLHRLVGPKAAEIVGKLESLNPGGSVKDRICAAMIEAAEKKGDLAPGRPAAIVEATSGNTGIGLAMVAAVKGYRCILTMPDDMSIERRQVLEAYGAELVLTPARLGMLGAVERAEEIARQLGREGKNVFLPRQFESPANPATHRDTTAAEILADTDGRLDAFVAGIGTGGTITGVGSALKSKLGKLLVVGVEPAASAVLSGEPAGLHAIQGIGAGFVPTILDLDVVDRIVKVTDAGATEMMRRLAREEGLFVGISSGAAVHAAIAVAAELGAAKRVLVMLPDGGMKYVADLR